ncbi:hypothetical protein PTKIN_Ptkin11bG0011700 [Pterospermum kingtungense]
MAYGTRSNTKAKDDEDNDSKGGLTGGKKSVNSGAATAEVSGVRSSPRETPTKRNLTPSSSCGTRKSERLEKQTANSNPMTPSAKRKLEQTEKHKNASPLRRSERGKMPSSSGSSGSKKSDKSPDSLDTETKKERKEKSMKQLTMESVEVEKNELENGQANEANKKKMNAYSYKALFTKQLMKAHGTGHSNDLNGTDSGREEDILEDVTEITHERTLVTSSSQSSKETLERNNEHKSFQTRQKVSSKDMSSTRGDPQGSKNCLVAGDMNDDAEKASLENLPSPECGGVLDCDVTCDMVQKVTDIDIDYVASPVISSNDICTSAGGRTSLSLDRKRKDCSESGGTCSKRQRVDSDSTEQEICSSNSNLNQLFGSSDIKDRGKLHVGISTANVEKPCNHMQQHLSSADLQTGSDRKTCIVCKLDGKLLCCRGKGCHRRYHISCLEPPLEEFPLGDWYCLACVRKKIESGVHSVSDGIEAVWDSRELEASEDGLGRQKQYFVKYKGLAHVHNRWVPENQMLLEAPSLVARYNPKNQGAVWKKQWAVPHRVLQKRLLTIPKECDEHNHKGHDGDSFNCHVEWLVKWCGLGYEHASWELENASFFSCPQGQSLIRDYETRRKKAKAASKFDKGEVASPKFSQLPASLSSGIHANLDAVNKLCNYWRRCQNAIIFDEKERIPNVIFSILSFPSNISKPFLIISTSSSQHSWDQEFLHLAPSADVVVYSGTKEIRNSIRNLEFYEGGGCIMFQVLITSPEVISEDLNVLDCIEWEAIIVDECQHPRIASCFEQIKRLNAIRRLLIIRSQLKDNVAEYLNLLSLLESQSNSNGSDILLTNSSDNIGALKERLAKYVAYECKSEPPRFIEYWVPVLLSNVQLEQYCFTLLSNSHSLWSPSKTDPVGAVRSILISSRKCCDHPYVVDESLQMLLTKGLKEVEFLDVGIKASGKLQLLDAMLLEIQKRKLKVLILFQYIGGSGRDLMGDILDDFIRQRFGADSYERVDGGLSPSKRQSALNKFNNETKRFIFLLETRACLSSIKLSAVGTVIIFGSDWSPMNDLRALQKITLDSPFEQIKIFRLYSSFTVEEKILMLSKQDKPLDSNIENISPMSSHMLLKWEASSLFSQLDKFHGIPTVEASTSSEQSHLKDVMQEFSITLHKNQMDNDASKLSLILQVKQNRGAYRTEMPLFGERKIQVMNEDPPHIFWTKLLEGKSPSWKYSSCSSQRNRKRVQYFDDLQKKPEAESAEVVKRHKKVVSGSNDHSFPKARLQEEEMAAGEREGSSGTSAYGLSPFSGSKVSGSAQIHATSNSIHLASNISKTPAVTMVEWEARRKQRDSQKNLHVLLKPQIAKLCEVLHLSEDAKVMAERFLEYVMNNHLVNREPETILQAFQISLCWSAASFLKHKVDHKESLALAKQHLGFTCKKEEADYVHSMLRCLKRLFLYRTGYLKFPNSPKASELSSKAAGRDHSNEAIAESELAPEFQLAQRDLLKSIKEIQKKCDKQMTKLVEKQKEEMKQFNQKYEEEKVHLENKKRTEAAVIRLHSNVSMRTDKLKNLDIDYARKFDELKQQMDLHLENLEALQAAAKCKVLERQTRWVEAVKSWARVELVKPPVNEANHFEGRNSVRVIQSVAGSEVRSSKIVHIVPDEVAAYSDPIDTARPYKENSEGATIEDSNVNVRSGAGEEQAVCKDLSTGEQVSVGEIPDGDVQVDVPVNVKKSVLPLRYSDDNQISDGSKLNMSNGDLETVPRGAQENHVPLKAPLSEEIPNGAALNKPDREAPLKAAENVSFCHGQENLASLRAPSSEKISDRDSVRKFDGEIPLREPATVISSEGRENLVSLEEPLSVKIPDRTTLSNGDGNIQSAAPEPVVSGKGPGNFLSVVAPSSKEIPGGTTLSVADGQLPLSASEATNSSEGQGNVMAANSSEKQIPDGTTLNVPDGEDPKSTCEIATSSDGMDNIVCKNPSTSKEQIPNPATLEEDETASVDVLNGGNVHREKDVTSVIEIGRHDGVQCTMNRESECHEPSLADVSSVQPVPTSDQGGPLPPDLVDETSSSYGAIDVTCIVSNPGAPVLEPREQMQQLRSTESTSDLSPSDAPSVRAIEDQPSSEGQTVNQVSQAPRQPVADHIELSNQDVLQPLDLPIDGAIGGLVREASEIRTASAPSVSSGLLLQTAPTGSSQMPLPLYRDPLQNEMERIRRETDQTVKVHEDTKLQLKSECEKEIEEVVAQIRRKYELKLQEKEVEFLLQKKQLDENYNKVLLNKILAEAFRSKCMDNRASGSAGAQQEQSSSFMQQLVQLSAQRALHSSTASGLSTGTDTSIQTASPAVVNAQTMDPSLQVVNPPTAFFSPTPTRPPHVSSITPSTGTHHIGSEIRAPAPHLQPFRPSTSVFPSTPPSQPRVILSRPPHNNPPVTSTSMLQSHNNPLAHRPASSTLQPGRIQHEISGGLAAIPNPSSDVLMGINNLSGPNTNSPSNLLPNVGSSLATPVHQESGMPPSNQPNPAQQSGAPDIVCLSDDD